MQSKQYLVKPLNPYGIYSLFLGSPSEIIYQFHIFGRQLFYTSFAPDILLGTQPKKITVYTQRYRQQRTTNKSKGDQLNKSQ